MSDAPERIFMHFQYPDGNIEARPTFWCRTTTEHIEDPDAVDWQSCSDFDSVPGVLMFTQVMAAAIDQIRLIDPALARRLTGLILDEDADWDRGTGEERTVHPQEMESSSGLCPELDPDDQMGAQFDIGVEVGPAEELFRKATGQEAFRYPKDLSAFEDNACPPTPGELDDILGTDTPTGPDRDEDAPDDPEQMPF